MNADSVAQAKTNEPSTTPQSRPRSQERSKDTAEEIILERSYTIRIRQRIVELGIPRTKRKKRAIKYIRDFVKRHMKVEDESLIKLDPRISEKIYSLGKGRLPSKISFKVKKLKSGVVRVELLE